MSTTADIRNGSILNFKNFSEISVASGVVVDSNANHEFNENYIKAMSNLIIKKQNYNFNGELFPPKIQCPNQFIKCPCLNYE